MTKTLARRTLLTLLAATFSIALSARSQVGGGTRPARDSAVVHPRVDTTHAGADSLFRLFLPPRSGALDPALDSTSLITRPELPWLDHRSLAGVLEYRPGVILRDQASIGQYTAPTIDGIDWRSIAVLWNGRPFSDPASGLFNPSLASTDYLERIELVTGPRAFLYGLNAAGGAVNLVTRNYNSNRPYTRFKYSESGYGYAQSDGTFAQNITRRMNVTAGFQFQGTDGRYLNSAHEQWNIRGKLRYGLTENLTLLLSEYFSSTNTDLSGGIDPAASLEPFNPGAATVVNPDAYEKITRHDLDLSFIGSFLPDTASVTTLTLYSSFNLREYRDEENRRATNDITGRFPSRRSPNGVFILSDHRSSWMGAHLTQALALPLNQFLFGLDAELLQVEGSPNIGRRRRVTASAWAKDEISLGNVVRLAVYGRTDSYLGQSRPGVGADARLTLAPRLSLFGGLSISSRVPNFTELYWADSTVTRRGDITAERHFVTEAGLRWSPGEGSQIELTLTHRTITDPILIVPYDRSSIFPALEFANGDREQLTSAALGLSLRFWHLLLEGTGTCFLDRSGGTLPDDLPRVWLYGGIYLRDDFFHGSLDIKAGVRGWYRSTHKGSLFNPEVLAYVPNTGPPLGQASTVDFVLNAHLGDADIHLIWENLPNIQYYATPYFPGLDREVRFGVAWEFWN
ncbi:MAG TPA: putative porin [Bacteroidota bacterium]